MAEIEVFKDGKVRTLRVFNFDTDDEYLKSLHFLFEKLFSMSDNVYVLGWRQDSMIFEDRAEYLKEKLVEFVPKNARFEFVSYLDDVKFSSISSVNNNDEKGVDYLILSWEYYYAIQIGTSKLNFDEMFSKGESLFEKDNYGQNKIAQGTLEVSVIKDMDLESIFITGSHDLTSELADVLK